jgi:predicted RNA-binding Zn-ribbon protein involved in translation (DUF1610 family)
MPDFTIEYYDMCSDLEEHKRWNVGGYTQSYFMGELTCTCKGYKFRKTCKHINEVEKNRCTWHGAYDEVQTKEQEKNHICPMCGKETVVVRVAV